MWRTSPNKAEREKRVKEVPRSTLLGVVTVTVPADLKVWALNEAHRREIPESWLVTEVLRIGIESYQLMGLDTQVLKYDKPKAVVEHKCNNYKNCGAMATHHETYGGWVCDDC